MENGRYTCICQVLIYYCKVQNLWVIEVKVILRSFEVSSRNQGVLHCETFKTCDLESDLGRAYQ